MNELQALPLHLYLASAPGDTEGERIVLERLVLPELRERAAKQGMQIKIVLVDPNREEWDLARRFQEIDECRPFFIALLGERYGEPPPAVPLSLVAAHPWLAEDAGRSILELEILHGVLHDSGKAAGSFFYLRDAQFTSIVPEQHRGRFLPRTGEEESRVARLKERIRSSGRPVYDGYPCAWSDGLGRASRLDAFAERVIEDLWKAIQDQTPVSRRVHPKGVTIKVDVIKAREVRVIGVAAGPPSPPIEFPPVRLLPEKPLVVHENVQFTVYRPRTVEPAKWYPLLAFAHLAELSEDAPPEEQDPVEKVKEEARRILGDLGKGYADVKQDSQYAVPHEAEITFLPEIPGFEVNPPRRTFLWLESVQREEFRIRAGAQLDGTLVRGRMSVFWGSILLAEISLAIKVDSRVAGTAQPPPERVASRPFRNIFPSYSHKDASIVEEFERFARTLGDRYLWDVTILRAGEVWNERLKELIRKADVFQLFWSWNAMRSPYVEGEWRYALTLGRSHFVRPTYWEDPLPEDPERGLPPEDLRRLHFQLLRTGEALGMTPHARLDPNATVAMQTPIAIDFGTSSSRAAATASMKTPPPFDDTTVAAAPSQPAPASAPAWTPPPPPPPAAYYVPKLPPLASTPRRRNWDPTAALLVMFLGVGIFGLSYLTISGIRNAAPNKPDAPALPPLVSETPSLAPTPVIDRQALERMATACRLDEATVRDLRTRALRGAPIVEVFASEKWFEAARRLPRFYGAFILPREDEGRILCTVVLGPFSSEGDAEWAAARAYHKGARKARVVQFPEFTE